MAQSWIIQPINRLLALSLQASNGAILLNISKGLQKKKSDLISNYHNILLIKDIIKKTIGLIFFIVVDKKRTISHFGLTN